MLSLPPSVRVYVAVELTRCWIERPDERRGWMRVPDSYGEVTELPSLDELD